MAVREGVRRGVDALSILTAGNGGYSLARMARGTGIRVAAIIDQGLSKEIRATLQSSGADLVEADLRIRMSPEQIANLARINGENIWDVSNTLEGAYGEIADEIMEEKPDTETIIVPVGSGELFLGIHRRLEELQKNVRLLGVGVLSSSNQAKKLYASWTPTKDLIKVIARDDMMFLTDEEVQDSSSNAPNGLQAEPSALVVFKALEKIHCDIEKLVCVNTGSGIL